MELFANQVFHSSAESGCHITIIKQRCSAVVVDVMLQQGRQTTRAYLEQYVTVSRPPLKDAPDRRSYCRDDLPHFIDDEVSEIIDENDYTEDACHIKQQR